MEYSGSVVFDQEWEFDIENIMEEVSKGIERKLLDSMQDGLNNSIEDMGHFAWQGADVCFYLETSDAAENCPTWRVSLGELVDRGLLGDLDRGSAIKVADEMEAQAKRLRAVVKEASE